MARRGPRPGTLEKVREALHLARTENLYAATAARRAGISVSTLRRYAGSALRVGPFGKLEVRPGDRLAFPMPVLRRGADRFEVIQVRGSRMRKEAASYWKAVSTLASVTSTPEERTRAAETIEGFRGRRIGGVEVEHDPGRVVSILVWGILRVPPDPYRID